MAFGPALIAEAPVALKAIFGFIESHFQTTEEKEKAQLDALKMAQDGKFKELELYLNDVANARARQVSVKDGMPSILATVVTAGFFIILVMIMRGMVAPGAENIVNIMLGSLGTAWISVMTYYFGSSIGSKQKDWHISNMIGKVTKN